MTAPEPVPDDPATSTSPARHDEPGYDESGYDEEPGYHPPAAMARPAVDHSSLFLGGVLALVGHVLPLIPPYLVGQFSTDTGEGFQDLANVLTALLISELVLAVVCVVAGIVLITKGRRRFGSGVIVGWAVGALAGYILFRIG